MKSEMIQEEATTTIAFDQLAFADVDNVVAQIREEAYDAIAGETKSRAHSLHRILGLCTELESKLHQGEITHE